MAIAEYQIAIQAGLNLLPFASASLLGLASVLINWKRGQMKEVSCLSSGLPDEKARLVPNSGTFILDDDKVAGTALMFVPNEGEEQTCAITRISHSDNVNVTIAPIRNNQMVVEEAKSKLLHHKEFIGISSPEIKVTNFYPKR